jgi:hypothetical protein
MLVLCYGMQKSGSTLAFELTCGVLQSAGFEQVFIRNDLHEPRDGRVYRNYVEDISADAIEDLISTAGPARKIAFKTHSTFPDELFPRLEELQAKRDLQIIASYRDPRDICLSLLDAGEKSRELERGGFGRFETLDEAAEFVKGRVARFRKWASLKGTLRLEYETVAYAPDEAIDRLEAVLGVTANRTEAMKHAFEDAFTQKNKATRRRYETEMTDKQKRQMEKIFRRFLNNACEEDNQAWYDKCRTNILAGRGED